VADLYSDWRLTRLPNGLRLITIARPGTLTIAARVYVRAGSRYDSEHEALDPHHPPLGLAHLAEHLLFKGTRRRSPREIFRAIECLGGVLDAGTTKEYSTLAAVVPRQGLVTALDVLAEVLLEPARREEDFWQEKLVALEEIRHAQDGEGILFDLFANTLWQVHPLRHPVLGTLDGLHVLDYQALLSFYRQRYVAGNMLLVLCGDMQHSEAAQCAAERFAALLPGPEQPPPAAHEPPMSSARTAHLEKDVHQTHLLIGVPTVSMKHNDRSALKAMERILGMGGSARLYQRLREQTHAVYNVNTVTAHYEDAGYFAVHTACAPGNIPKVRATILEEWDKLRQEWISADELSAAKSNYAGTLACRFETNLALASIFGLEGLLHQVEPFDAAVQRMNAVQPEDIQRVARTYLDADKCVTVTVGRKTEA
jgi:predicted Zn-dependent peptidase